MQLGALLPVHASRNASAPGLGATVTAVSVMDTRSMDPRLAIRLCLSLRIRGNWLLKEPLAEPCDGVVFLPDRAGCWWGGPPRVAQSGRPTATAGPPHPAGQEGVLSVMGVTTAWESARTALAPRAVFSSLIALLLDMVPA